MQKHIINFQDVLKWERRYFESLKELFKRRKSASGGPKSQLEHRRILGHSKIIEANSFTKIKADQEIFNFEAFSTYEASNKIVWYSKTLWKC